MDEVLPSKTDKYCNRCGKWKPLHEFYKRGKSKYVSGYCRKCHNRAPNYEKIECPHCKEKILFMGVDHNDKIVKQKSQILRKLKKEVREELKEKAAKKKEVKSSLKDVFNDIPDDESN